MSHYTDKMINAINTTGCVHYKRKAVVEEWDGRWGKCNNVGCENREKKRCIKGHVHKGQSKKIFITPLCDPCNAKGGLMVFRENYFVEVAGCNCCTCKNCSI